MHVECTIARRMMFYFLFSKDTVHWLKHAFKPFVMIHCLCRFDI